MNQKRGLNRFSKLPDDGDPWASNNLLTPEQKKTPVGPQWDLSFYFYLLLLQLVDEQKRLRDDFHRSSLKIVMPHICIISDGSTEKLMLF